MHDDEKKTRKELLAELAEHRLRLTQLELIEQEHDKAVAAQRKSAAEVARAMEKLARSNKELEEFAYIVSHDLQEPLRMVSSYVQLLEKRYGDKLDSDAGEFIEFAVDGAKRMQRLINDLLLYSRVRSTGKPPEPVEMERTLKAVCDNLKIAIEECDAQVTHDELPVVAADVTQMAQLLQNLVGNAVKFRGKEPPRVHVSAARDGTMWRFAVRDNGIGIAEKDRKRIFLVFQRLHRRGDYSGTGIGLAVAKQIIERHGGRIRVACEPGAGTTFEFTLPAGDAA